MCGTPPSRSWAGRPTAPEHLPWRIRENMNEIEVVALLGALAQSVRLRVFRELVTAGDTGLTPGMLGERLNIPGTTLSFHLRELLHAVACLSGTAKS